MISPYHVAEKLRHVAIADVSVWITGSSVQQQTHHPQCVFLEMREAVPDDLSIKVFCKH